MTQDGRRQLLVFGGVFAVVALALVVVYVLFLRAAYVPLSTGLRASDAAAVVAELDKDRVPYRLGDGGATVLVPEDRIDATRLALAGSDLQLSGEAGFELFDESDMGLTEFAQKINYQRALQGELARTIMGMDGVEQARVHLAMPERTLFRGPRSAPKAAVTLRMRSGGRVPDGMVVGIQRLVAFAVPELSFPEVAVLDERGRVVSGDPVSAATGAGPASGQSEIERFYTANARRAVTAVLPGLSYELAVQALPGGSSSSAQAEGREAGDSPSGAERDLRLRVTIAVAPDVSEQDRGVLRTTVVDALALDVDSGDGIAITAGPLGTASPASAVADDSAAAPEGATANAPSTTRSVWSVLAYLVVAGAVLLAIVLMATLGRARGALSEDESRSFAQALDDHLEGAADQTYATV